MVVVAAVLFSGIASAIGAKKKKAAARALRKTSGEPSTSLQRAASPQPAPAAGPRSVMQPLATRGVAPKAPERRPLDEIEAERAAAQGSDDAYMLRTARSRPRFRWGWKQAVIVRTILGPPRALEGWNDQ